MGFEPGRDSPVACPSQRSNPLGHGAPLNVQMIQLMRECYNVCMNATMDERMLQCMCGVRKLSRIRNERIKETMKGQEISKKVQERSLKTSEVLWACDGKKWELCREEGRGNGETREEEARKAWEMTEWGMISRIRDCRGRKWMTAPTRGVYRH